MFYLIRMSHHLHFDKIKVIIGAASTQKHCELSRHFEETVNNNYKS